MRNHLGTILEYFPGGSKWNTDKNNGQAPDAGVANIVRTNITSVDTEEEIKKAVTEYAESKNTHYRTLNDQEQFSNDTYKLGLSAAEAVVQKAYQKIVNLIKPVCDNLLKKGHEEFDTSKLEYCYDM